MGWGGGERERERGRKLASAHVLFWQFLFDRLFEILIVYLLEALQRRFKPVVKNILHVVTDAWCEHSQFRCVCVCVYGADWYAVRR